MRRITLNRPEKRNAINNGMRAELFAALEAADVDDAVHVTIVRGAGPCFSSGYDLKRAADDERPYYTAGGDGSWSRHVTEGWVHIWDLAKPVIAQVHGYAMAGGTELVGRVRPRLRRATTRTFSYPVVRVISPPDFQYHPWLVGMRNAMELVLTGDPITGDDAVRMGLANRARSPPAELDAQRDRDRGAASRACPPSCCRSTSAACTGRWRSWASAPGIRAGSELQGLASKLPAVQALLAGDPIASVKQAAGR